MSMHILKRATGDKEARVKKGTWRTKNAEKKNSNKKFKFVTKQPQLCAQVPKPMP
eukprot:m.157111 g.157111  ORF g.157111 m.157111 type:complete len:55 (+) comp15108_c0_seq3:1230-1394(+)